MIRPNDDGPMVYLCVEPIDGRNQINGLAQVVQDTLALNPFSAQLFVFTNKRRDCTTNPSRTGRTAEVSGGAVTRRYRDA